MYLLLYRRLVQFLISVVLKMAEDLQNRLDFFFTLVIGLQRTKNSSWNDNVLFNFVHFFQTHAHCANLVRYFHFGILIFRPIFDEFSTDLHSTNCLST